MDVHDVVRGMENRLHEVVRNLGPDVKERYLFGWGSPASDLLIVFSSNDQTQHNTSLAIPRASRDVWVEELARRGSDWNDKRLEHEIATLWSLAVEAVHRMGSGQGPATTQLLRRTLRDRNLAPSRNLLLALSPPGEVHAAKPWLGIVVALATDEANRFQ